MTEQEAIKVLKRLVLCGICTTGPCDQCERDLAKKVALTALEEIQQYRAIGTVEECRVAREKRIPKKIENRSVIKTFPMSIHGDCPTCGSKNLSSANTDYCNACGQALDWSE